MEPVTAEVTAVNPQQDNMRDYIEKGKWCCSIAPLPILGCVAVGGTGFALWSGFGSGTLQAANIANIAYDSFAVVAAVFTGGCYYYNLPNKSFEENVEVQVNANEKLEKMEGDLSTTIDTLHVENERLTQILQETDQKATDLKKELDQKSTHLIELSDELKRTIEQLELLKDDFGKADIAINDAKKLIGNMVALSKKMSENIKTSKVAANLFKTQNLELNKEIKSFDLENEELAELLKNYKEIVVEEHKQFTLLMKTCDELRNNTQSLKDQVQEFSDDEDEFSDDVDRDIDNTNQLEILKNQLENFNTNFDV